MPTDSTIVTFISSDPHRRLRPIYAKLRANGKFGLLAQAHQWDELVRAAGEAPAKADQMREYSPAAKIGLLGWLSDTFRENPDPERAVLLWSMKKGERDLTCVPAYVPNGIDLRFYDGVEVRRTQLCKDGPEVQALAEQRRAALLECGWNAT
jgi:hypothetical protein